MQKMFTICSVNLDSADNFFWGDWKLWGGGTFPPKGAWIKPWPLTLSLFVQRSQYKQF